ncbi:hypothetical protein EVAR_80552_1 [Eumeta japonica]|uniref:Uncharacterized protein n=1 Tax=Eumeta variegata TaxID=151549 RepID=A0A4C1TMC4_EUMVA|nr:hypothetical protein EVAR_80552_1 [Eumeta japonica]
MGDEVLIGLGLRVHYGSPTRPTKDLFSVKALRMTGNDGFFVSSEVRDKWFLIRFESKPRRICVMKRSTRIALENPMQTVLVAY